MSLPNPEIWGTPDTWVNTSIIYTPNSYPTIKAGKAKVASFRNLYNGIGQGKFEYGVEPIDITTCPVGQDPEASCFGKMYIIGTSSIPSTDTINPEVIKEFDTPINWCFTENGPGTQGWTIRNYYTSMYNGSHYRWSPNTGTINTNSNRNAGVCPFTYYQLKSLLLSVKVLLIDGYSDSYYGNMPYSQSGTWVTLANWRDNYPNKKAFRIKFDINSVYNADLNNITYQNYDNSMGSFDTVSVALLDGLELIKNDSTLFYDYATFQIQAKSRSFYLVNDQHGNSDTYVRHILMSVDKFENTTIRATKGTSNDYVYCIWQEVPYSEKNYETIMKMVACFGVPFTDTNKLSFKLDYTDNELCLPVIDENGVAHGEYTRGTANTTNDLYNADSVRDKNYDPTKPPAPTPSSDPMLPEGLYFTMANRGTGIWALTPTEVDQVWNDIFGKNIDVKMFGNQPMNAILSLKWTPFNWDIGSLHNQPVVLGDTVVNRLHKYPMIETVIDAEIHGYGTMKFNYDKNFFNARYMQARLFLPFYGYYELPAAQLLSSKLRVDFYYNVPDELGVYIISYDDVIYDYCECSVDIDVPLTGSNAAAIAASKRSEALTIATQIAAMATAAVVGWSGISAVGAGIKTIAEAGAEGAWAFGGSKLLAGLANIGPLASENLLPGVGKGLVGIGAGGGIGGIGIANTIQNAKIDRAALKTNLPYHGSALQTTFLHMSMKPYVQIFRNAIMEGLENSGNTVDQTLSGNSEAQYKLKVGHACDIWTTISEMPENSLLQATGIADSSMVNMELAEVQELNSILQTGFYK